MARLSPSRLLVLVVGAALVLGAGTALAWAGQYQPISEGSLAGVPASRETIEDDGQPVWVAGYRDRTFLEIHVSVRNDGRWPVRIERVGASAHPEWAGLLTMRPDRNRLVAPGGGDARGEPFRPFVLDRDEERVVIVMLWLDHCERTQPGSAMRLESIPVRYRAFGMAHTTSITLRQPVEVRSTEAACPRGTRPDTTPR